MDILKKELDNDQLAAAATLDKGLLVLAGPGSGKTRVLTHRIGYLLRTHQRRDFKVLGLTFSNKAAREMSERLRSVPGYHRDRAFVGTFHRFCREVLQHYACYVGRSRQFSILAPEDQLVILGECLSTLRMNWVKPQDIRGAIEYAQRRLLTPDAYRSDLLGRRQSGRAADVYRLYEERKQISNILDFNDLINLCVDLFRSQPAIAKIHHDTFEFVCIDECQDTTLAQLELIKLLVPKDTQAFFAVADEDQLIYEWNEARLENLNDLIIHFNLSVFNLNRNYRCPPSVLDLANRLIVYNVRRFANRKKQLVSVKPVAGDAFSYVEVDDPTEEAAFIVQTIQDLRKAHHEAPYGHFAIIARAHYLFSDVKTAFSDAGIPYIHLGHENFLTRPEVGTFLHAMRLVHNANDAEALRRLCVYLDPTCLTELTALQQTMLSFGASLRQVLMGEVQIAEITNHTRWKRVQDLYRRLVSLQAYNLTVKDLYSMLEDLLQVKARLGEEASPTITEKLSDLEAFENFIGEFLRSSVDTSLATFLSEVLLKGSSTDLSSVEKTDPATVKLLSIHAAKGTEYPFVSIIGLDDGYFPRWNIKNGSKEMEEERRSCYVAITRTMEYLWLIHSKTRPDRYDTLWPKKPSRFVQEMLG